MTTVKDQSGFRELGLAGSLVTALSKKNIITPTQIQYQAIPVVLSGNDVVGIAQTGTGKTLAFGLPMIQRIAITKGRGLIILPTRELAQQVDEMLHGIARQIGLRTAVLIGGEPMPKQLRQLRARPHIIIATPGRLNDHRDQKTVRLDGISIVVLDEADRMLDMGFLPQIKDTLQSVPKDKQMLLFSATMPLKIFSLASQFMQSPTHIEVVPSGTAVKEIDQEVIFVEKSGKERMLHELLNEEQGSILVFSRTKHGAIKLTRNLVREGFGADDIHGNKTLPQRRKALASFKSGRVRVLVATDVAARGIDVSDIALVINYDLPDNPEDYIHRIGRTGRAGKNGRAVSLASPDQAGDVKQIERLMRMQLPRSKKSDESKDFGLVQQGQMGRAARRGVGPRNRRRRR